MLLLLLLLLLLVFLMLLLLLLILLVAIADSCRMGLCERRTLKQGVQLLDEIPSQPRLRPTKASSQPRLGWLWHLFWRSASAFFSAALARVALHGGRRHKCNSTRWSTIMLYISYRCVEVCLSSHCRHCRDTTSDDNRVATSCHFCGHMVTLVHSFRKCSEP